MELERLTLGGTLNFTTLVSDFLPTDGWTLKYRLVPRSSGSPIDLTSTQDSSDSSLHRVQVAAAVTANWTPGAYSWASWVEQGSEKYDVNDGSITLLPDPRTATTLDIRTPARRALDDAKAALYTWSASATTVRYKIGEREMQFNTKAEIAGLISRLEVEVNREVNTARRAQGLAPKNRVFVRCTNA